MQKHKFKHFLILVLCLPLFLSARQIDTFYGPIEVQEPVLLELIDSPLFQRLKLIHQYGVAYYTTHTEEYNRYDHSIGVFTILRSKGASLEEQIAGLLHDVSHTAFSHVGDWVYNKENEEEDYQDCIHASFLEKSELGQILKKHNFTVDQVLPEGAIFPALENSLPNLCADRIDYNLQGAYFQGFISHEEALTIFNEIEFIDDRWVSGHPELMKKLAQFSLFMTQGCWGSPTNYATSRWFADAIIRGMAIGSISFEEFHFGTDQEIWNKLILHDDPIIRQKMAMVMNSQDHLSLVDPSEADVIVKSKFRGINPWIRTDSGYSRLTEVDPDLAEEFDQARKVIEQGWPIKIIF